MIDKARYRPKAPRWFNRLLRNTFGRYLRNRFAIRATGLHELKAINPPYVLIPTHHGVLDPFMVGAFIRQPVYWVTGDGNMRSRLMKFLLGLVGAIPKSKAIPDLETIGWIVEVIRRRGGIVGLFAEGQASWDGHTQPIVPATGKLVKLLKVPVVVAVLKGSYSSQPRWSWNGRPGYMEIEFKLALTAREAKERSPEEIVVALEKAMAFDEEAWRVEHPTRHRGSGRARHLELALFMCPACERVGAMRSLGNRLYCRSCGHVVRLARDYSFMSVGLSKPCFSTIRQWDTWQAVAFERYLAGAEPGKPLLSDPGALLRGRRTHPLLPIRSGTLVLYHDRVELATMLGEAIRFPISAIEGEGVLKQQILEFYVDRTLYQVRFPFRFQSARKWSDAIGLLRARTAADSATERPVPGD